MSAVLLALSTFVYFQFAEEAEYTYIYRFISRAELRTSASVYLNVFCCLLVSTFNCLLNICLLLFIAFVFF